MSFQKMDLVKLKFHEFNERICPDLFISNNHVIEMYYNLNSNQSMFIIDKYYIYTDIFREPVKDSNNEI